MTTIQQRPTATITADGVTYPVSTGEMTVDESWAPYCQGTVEIPFDDPATVGAIDPRAGDRATVSAAVVAGSPRTFNLGIRSRVIDYRASVARLRVASDEALLQDYAPLADDTTPFTYQTSLRALVNYVLGLVIPGDATLSAAPPNDADVSRYQDAVNLIPNGSFEVDLAGWTASAGNVVQTRANDWAAAGAWNLRLEPNGTTNTTFSETANLLGSTVSAGKTYMVRATCRLNAVLSGTLHGSSRRVEVYHRIGNGAYTSILATQPPNVVGTYEEVVKFTVPTGTTELRVRLWNGANTTSWVRWDAVRLSEASADVTDTRYFDGATPATAGYSYTWSAAANASTSVRTALIDRPPDALYWRAGVTAWDLLEPLCEAAALRLFCDEQRVWRLVPQDYALPTVVALIPSRSVEAVDTVTRDDSPWADGVVVRYLWEDPRLGTQRRTDAAGASGKVLVEDRPHPYPGPGAAAAILQAVQARGRTQEVEALTDYTTTPGMSSHIPVPGGLISGRVRDVTFTLDTGLMRVASKDQSDLAPGMIDALLGTIDALVGTIDAL